MQDQALMQEPAKKNLNPPITMEEQPSDPPLEIAFQHLLDKGDDKPDELPVVKEAELPLIDLNQLQLGESERQACKQQIAKASREWGFFQVVNHGISRDILDIMRAEQMKLFKKPFEEKKAYAASNFSSGSYRWGTPSATKISHVSWSEAFHVPLNDVIGSGEHNNSLSSTMEQFAVNVSELAQTLADILADETGYSTRIFKETCVPSSCYLRLNRYPPCAINDQMLGIISHTDSSFLTVLHQDGVGGLQLVKNGEWIAVKPNPDTLIINIGDLFQAWSNDLYKSVEHRVVSNPMNERFSTAYFYCPSHDTVIQSGHDEPRVYRSFSFGEFQKQVKQDVCTLGYKIGLSRFLNN
ncbi:hypothetical protein CASFOL_028932 [Castilleja foliolosa]|uniref:Fe2OG dioxygenase domain-containing protein n=1 Tax=Castilleja foliolosa TaxID=1961234 RepID=A0ABD3CDD8_9LAMI